jgi:hypothetical protein
LTPSSAISAHTFHPCYPSPISLTNIFLSPFLNTCSVCVKRHINLLLYPFCRPRALQLMLACS